MKKTYFKKRPKNPLPLISNSFESASLYLASGFLKSGSFRHALTKGIERENPLKVFLAENLPGMYRIVSGEVVDQYDHHSGQIDIIIFDGQRNFAFYDGTNTILPAEAFLVGIEVKSKLNKSEVKKALKAASLLRPIKPNEDYFVSRRARGEETKGKYRYFYCLFAYGTDITRTDWLSKEYKRLAQIATDLGLPDPMFDRIYVANYGVLCPLEKIGKTETPNSGVGFMTFYTHILNFLLRENSRRPELNYLQYAGGLSKGWRKLG